MACLGKSTNRPSVPFIPEHPPQMLYNPLSIFKSHLSFCPPPPHTHRPSFFFCCPQVLMTQLAFLDVRLWKWSPDPRPWRSGWKV